MIEDDLRLETFGVLEKSLHQIRALDAVDVSRPVVHLGGGHELATLGEWLRDPGSDPVLIQLANRICALTETPPLSPQEYRVCFQHIAELLQHQGSGLNEMSKNLRDHAKDQGIALSRQDATGMLFLLERNGVNLQYAGKQVEQAETRALFRNPHHPYTNALLNSLPDFSQNLPHKSALNTLPGSIPPLQHLPIGCRLGPRCPYAQKMCVRMPGVSQSKGHQFYCHSPLNMEDANR